MLIVNILYMITVLMHLAFIYIILPEDHIKVTSIAICVTDWTNIGLSEIEQTIASHIHNSLCIYFKVLL